MYALLSNVPSWHENIDGKESAGVLVAPTVKPGPVLLFWEQGVVCVWEFRTACVFACVLGASCGDMWKEKNSHGSFTPCDTSNRQDKRCIAQASA